MGQEVLAPPPPEFSQQAPAFRPWVTNQHDTLTPMTATEQKLMQWGPVCLRPHLLYRLSYGDGIQAQPGQQSKTMINALSPGILMDLGNHWHLDYTPTMRFYSSSAFRNATDQSVLFNGGTTYEDWAFGLSQSYVSSFQPLVETASQTETVTYLTALNATYHMSSKMSLELGVNQNFRFLGQGSSTNQQTDSRVWSTMDWLNYQFWPNFGAAVGVGGGYVDVAVGTDMTYEQLQGRINWRAGDKLSFSLNGGLEDRQFLGSQVPDAIYPILGLTMLYQLFEPTTLSLTANRTVTVSYFQNQITEVAAFSGSIRQRLLKKLYLDLTGGYSTTSYQATTTSLTVNRQDDHSFINVRLTCPFLKRATASAFYNWSENISNESGFQYSSTQIGLELGYRL